jgi:hypothetical protein
MSKVTVVTDAAGKIAVIGHGYLSEASAKKAGHKGPRGGLRAPPGHHLHELDIAEDVKSITKFKELHDKVAPHVSAKSKV